ncbi:PP2C family protein-serine/threonine phosphatase [Sessilibacter corallicola]|uniref:PP2C family protein-serine/threonine phosphatase n=1 Tax=Sessilibacter corallicola TaxID=2904075 RepID=UPI001E61FC04|nr:hypothetical protein [Sessilibacter corallicola]MCE2026693.1 hypothetical protein [Sessilibacter corallicola]
MIFFSDYLESADRKGDDELLVVEKNQVIWFCLSDGAGGTGNGSVASRFIVDSFKAVMSSDEFKSPDNFETFLRKIDKALFQSNLASEATVIVGKIENNVVMGASVGDSQAWFYASNYTYQLTSLQYRRPLLGSGRCVAVGFGPLELQRYLLIGSDGLFNYCQQKTLRAVLANKKVKAESVAKCVERFGGKLNDDLSVILIERESAN